MHVTPLLLSHHPSPTMASSTSFILILFMAFTALAMLAETQVVGDGSLHLMTEPMEWPSASYSYPFAGEDLTMDLDGDDEVTKKNRRALFWHRFHHYYISYGALSANRIPCRPRSGRSYYSHNCYRARGPVNPYSRGCSAITRCRR